MPTLRPPKCSGDLRRITGRARRPRARLIDLERIPVSVDRVGVGSQPARSISDVEASRVFDQTQRAVHRLLQDDVRRLPRNTDGTARPRAQSPSGARNASTAAKTRPSIQGSGCTRVRRIDREPFAQRVAARFGLRAQPLDLRPRLLRVHVVGRDRRHAAPVVDPPRRAAAGIARRKGSAAPARSRAARAGCAPPRSSRGSRRARASRLRRPSPSTASATKFCTITSWMWPYLRASARNANSDSTRSRAVSPMPIRIPVVNGIARRPASSITRSRTVGFLSGDP